MESIAYYPGCSSHGSSKEYDKSCREVLSRYGYNMREIDDWNCCGATPAHATNDELAVALPLRNLVIAENSDFEGVFTPCAACYSRLKHASHEVETDENMRKRMVELVGKEYRNTLEVMHILDLLYWKIGLEKIKEEVTQKLDNLKVASYYGCLLVRPPKIVGVDADYENPMIMDEVAAATGAQPVDWPHKTECCGASHTMAHTDSVRRLVHRILKSARLAGADCVVVACPLCHANLDMRQREAEKMFNDTLDMPILYISQLLGLSMGLNPGDLGMKAHLVNTRAVLEAVKS